MEVSWLKSGIIHETIWYCQNSYIDFIQFGTTWYYLESFWIYWFWDKGIIRWLFDDIFVIFSSPEHKVLKVSYCDHPVSVVRRQSSVVCRQQFIQSTSPPKLLDQFQNNFTQMFPWSSFIKIAKMVPLRWTKWPSELKIEKPLYDISSQANGPISK